MKSTLLSSTLTMAPKTSTCMCYVISTLALLAPCSFDNYRPHHKLSWFLPHLIEPQAIRSTYQLLYKRKLLRPPSKQQQQEEGSVIRT